LRCGAGYPALLADLPGFLCGGHPGEAQQIHPFVSSTERQISALFRRRPLTIIAILLLSALIWVFMIAEYWLMLTFLGIELDWCRL